MLSSGVYNRWIIVPIAQERRQPQKCADIQQVASTSVATHLYYTRETQADRKVLRVGFKEAQWS